MPASSELAPQFLAPQPMYAHDNAGSPKVTGAPLELITGVPDFSNKSQNPFMQPAASQQANGSGMNLAGNNGQPKMDQIDWTKPLAGQSAYEATKSLWWNTEAAASNPDKPSLAALQLGHTAFNLAVDYIGGEQVISQERAKLGMMKKLGNYVTGKFAQLKVGKDSADSVAAQAFATQTSMAEMKAWSSPVLPPIPQFSGWGEATYAPPAQKYERYKQSNQDPIAPEIIEDTPGYQSAINLETASKAVELLETQNFVAEAPKFADQLTDETRTNTFTYVKTGLAKWNDDPTKYEQQVTLTEHDGLVQLAEFLDTAAAELPNGSQRLIEQAKGIRENLTFIGSKEYQEAAAGLAELWKAHLDSDSALQLCVPTKISERGGKRKSDIHLFENILSTFSDTELEQYSGRILTDMKDITEAPDHTKIILLDDWSISGTQAREAYHDMQADPRFAEYRNSLEINLLVSSQDRLENGLKTNMWDPNSAVIPVKAYFKAHDAAATSTREHKAHVTGIHSSVDFDFEQNIGDMVTALRHTAFQKTGTNVVDINMPPVTNIVREYRHAKPLIKKTKSGTFKRNKV
jgi:hypothetical protein